MLAAAPAWFADNVVPIAAGTLLVLTYVVVRMIQKVALRTALLCLIAAVAVFIYANRAPLKVCARSCKCEIAGKHITVPTCEPSLSL